MLSKVETVYLEKSDYKFRYEPDEKIGVVVVDNFPSLGRLTALRFLEWVQQNPEGVISLPTGKTPEHFIRETLRYLDKWSDADVQAELEESGIDPVRKPDLGGLHFVQIDEFYPIDPTQHNSFYNYVTNYYIDGFGLDRKKALLINCNEIGLPEGYSVNDLWGDEGVDLSLRYKAASGTRESLQKDVISRIDQWCVEYEDKIQELGGIGFFLGGIGPDGHIGFNVRGSDLHSTTRLTEINYETMAAASSDLGGMEVSSRSLVITIGLETITRNRECTAVIIAAGEAKAGIVADSIQHDRDVLYPSTALQVLPNARFYITKGACGRLYARNVAAFEKRKEVSAEEIEGIVVNLSVKTGRTVESLTERDYLEDNFGRKLLALTGRPVQELNSSVRKSLVQKIESGIKATENTVFLHTEPHHDDVMLGYLPYVVRNIRVHSNSHYFATFTSGFTAVTNFYMLDLCRRLRDVLEKNMYDFKLHLSRGYFDPSNQRYRNRDVWKYLDGVAAMSPETREEGTLRRFMRNVMELYGERTVESVKTRVEFLIAYFESRYPGEKDTPDVQKLKGMTREWESACLWGYFGWNGNSIYNLSLGFYQGDIFTEEPTVSRDVLPVVDLLEKVNPDVVSVAFDPEASGPDTHYKVMQAVAEALKMYKGGKNTEIIGYRNVWFRFQPHEANVFVPVSLNMLTLQKGSFMNTYLTQKSASFPSYEYDGPFPLLAQKIQVEQYEILKTCLGRDFFFDHPSALIRATRGFVFLKKMKLDEFLHYSRDLKRKAEDK